MKKIQNLTALFIEDADFSDSERCGDMRYLRDAVQEEVVTADLVIREGMLVKNRHGSTCDTADLVNTQAATKAGINFNTALDLENIAFDTDAMRNTLFVLLTKRELIDDDEVSALLHMSCNCAEKIKLELHNARDRLCGLGGNHG